MIPIISFYGHCIVSRCANKDPLFGSLWFLGSSVFTDGTHKALLHFMLQKRSNYFLLIMAFMLPYPAQYLPIPLSQTAEIIEGSHLSPRSSLIEFQGACDSSWKIRFYLLRILNWTLEIGWGAWTEKWRIAEMGPHVWAKYLPKQKWSKA